MPQLQVIHSGSYHKWPESPRIIVISDALAEALDNLLIVADDVVSGTMTVAVLAEAVANVKRLHDFDRFTLGGELTAPEAEPGAGEETR